MKIQLRDYSIGESEHEVNVVTIFNNDGFELSVRVNKDGSFNVNGSRGYYIISQATNSIDIKPRVR